MLIDVLVLMVLVDRHAHGTHLGQHHLAQPGLHHHVDTRDRVVAEQQLVQFRGHPFRGDAAQLRSHALQRVADPRRDGEAQLGYESGRPQHAQRIVAERHLRGSRSVQHARPQRLEAVERVEELAGTGRRDAHRHRVDREVAAHQVVFEPIAEPHLRVPRHPVVGIGAKGGDLEPVITLTHPDGPELDAGVPEGVGPGAQRPLDLLGARVGGEVQIGAQAPEQRVAHTAADEVELVARIDEESS